MRALIGELLLLAWDKGITGHGLDRPLTMLSIAMPEMPREHLAELPIAKRNMLLLQLRALTFGRVLKAYATCSGCATPLEFSVSVDALLARADELAAQSNSSARLRPVNSCDLLSILSARNPEDAEDLLLHRCLIPGTLDSVASVALRKEFEAVNASAEIVFTLECAACSRRETADLDIARFLWAEVCRAAARLLAEVHTLASQYGWSEDAIAAMSPHRRSAYMEILNA